MLQEYENFIHNKFGWCYYEVIPGEIPIIYNLYIEPQYRRQGHAKELLKYIIEKIRTTGYTGKINIEANPKENSIKLKLIKFYTDMGLTIMEV